MWYETEAYLLMNMAGVLLYKLCEAYVIWAQFAQPVQDTGLTGVKERQVLGHLWVKLKLTNTDNFINNLRLVINSWW